MALELTDIKEFLRVDGEYDNSVIQSLLNSAKVELAKSGVKARASDADDYALYETAVKIIVARDYEDRGFSEKDMRIIDSIILKLKDFSSGEVTADET